MPAILSSKALPLTQSTAVARAGREGGAARVEERSATAPPSPPLAARSAAAARAGGEGGVAPVEERRGGARDEGEGEGERGEECNEMDKF